MSPQHIFFVFPVFAVVHEVILLDTERYGKIIGVIHKHICTNESVLVQLSAQRTDYLAFLTFTDLTQT